MAGIGIGELSRRTGVNIETIRYFEKVGLIESPSRTEGGHRNYDERQVRALGFVSRARDLGFNQEEIRGILGLGRVGAPCCDDVRAIAGRHLEKVRRKIADLQRLEHQLASAMDQCSGRHVPECAVIDMLDISRDDNEAP